MCGCVAGKNNIYYHWSNKEKVCAYILFIMKSQATCLTMVLEHNYSKLSYIFNGLECSYNLSRRCTNFIYTSHSGISPSTASSPSHRSCRMLIHAANFRSVTVSFAGEGTNTDGSVATFEIVKSRMLRPVEWSPLLKKRPFLTHSGSSESVNFDGKRLLPAGVNDMEAMEDKVLRY